MNAKSLRTIAILGVAVFVLASGLICFSASTSALGADRMRVALPDKSFGQLPLFIGIRAGLFKDEGLEVQWLLIRSNAIAPALIGGEIEFAAAASPARLTAVMAPA